MNAAIVNHENQITIEIEELEAKIAPQADSAFLD